MNVALTLHSHCRIVLYQKSYVGTGMPVKCKSTRHISWWLVSNKPKTCSCMMEAQTPAISVSSWKVKYNSIVWYAKNTPSLCRISVGKAFHWYQCLIVIVKGWHNEVPLLMTSNNSIVWCTKFNMYQYPILVVKIPS